MTNNPISKINIYENFFAELYNTAPKPIKILCYREEHSIIFSTKQNKSEKIDFGYLSSPVVVSDITKYVEHNKINTVVLDTCLEDLRDVRPILTTVRELSIKLGINSEIIFSSQLNEHRRCWITASAKKLLENSGLIATELKINEGFGFTVSSNDKHYNDFLNKHSMPKNIIEHLMVTTEHSDYRITGGIGSYVKECEKLYGQSSSVLIIDSNNDLDEEKINSKFWFCAQNLIGSQRVDIIDKSNYDMLSGVVYESVRQLLFYYPRIKTIEAQEILLDRTINAKQAGLIPKEVTLVTTCHGASFHLAKAKKDILELEQIHVAYREKRTIEDSDVTIFPTKFLKNSYAKIGIKKLDEKNKIIKRLPFDISRLPIGSGPEEYRQIVYIGKTSSIKGFDIFLETIIEFANINKDLAENIEVITAIVTSTDITEKPIIKLLEEARKLYTINLVSMQREDLLAYLATNSKDSLALVTYPGDNHPTVILELLAIGHDFLALNCGGTPELIPDRYEHQYIVENNTNEVCKKIENVFRQPGNRQKIIQKARNDYLAEQKKINSIYITSHFETINSNNNETKTKNHSEVFIDIIGNKQSIEYEKTISSINSQITDLKIHINEKLITSPNNYFMRLLAGDVLDADGVEMLVSSISGKDEYGAVMANEIVSKYENYRLKNVSEFNPVQPQLGSVFLQEKYKRRVVGLFKSTTLSDDISELSDWELAIFVTSSGKKVAILPEFIFELQRRDDDVEWDHQNALETMSRVLFGLEQFDTYILFSQLKRLDDLYFGSRLYNHLAEMYVLRDDPSIIYGATPNMVKAIGAYRRYTPKPIHKAAVYSVKKIHKAGKTIKSLRNNKLK